MSIKNIEKDEVIIKTFYSSLNYKDILICSGNPGLVRKYPHIPGIDASGIVIKSHTKKLKVGDKVFIVAQPMGVKSFGGLAEYIKVPVKWVEKLPFELTLKNAIVFGTAGFTAMQAILLLLKNGLKKNKKPILVSGATGGVGTISTFILSKLGFDVCASTRKMHQASFLKKIGAKEIVSNDEFSNQPNMPLLSIKFSAIIDNIGGDIISVGSRQLINEGKIAAIGNTSSEVFNANIMPFILRGIQIIGVNAESASITFRKKIWKELNKISKDKKLKHIYTECKLSNVIDAIKKAQEKNSVGRVIIKIN